MTFPGVIQGRDGDQFGDQVDALFPIGTKMSLPDGRLFRYAEMGNTTGVANKLYQCEVAKGGWLTELVQGDIAVGDNHCGLENTNAAIAENDFAEGYIMLEETGDLGHYYVVRENLAVGSGAPGSTVDAVFFKRGVYAMFAVADGSGNVTNIFKNLWKDIIIKPGSDQTAPIVGIPPSIIVANDWGWCQTKGMAGCVYDASQEVAVIGFPACPDTTTGGAFMGSDYSESGVADNGTIGWVVEICPDEDFGFIYLTVE